MRSAVVMDGIPTIEWVISFKVGAILATALHLDLLELKVKDITDYTTLIIILEEELTISECLSTY